jgi:hypothetical protein
MTTLTLDFSDAADLPDGISARDMALGLAEALAAIIARQDEEETDGEYAAMGYLTSKLMQAAGQPNAETDGDRCAAAINIAAELTATELPNWQGGDPDDPCPAG